MDPVTHEVVRSNAVEVEKYLKGSGTTSIRVLTLGGEFEADRGRGKELFNTDYGGAPQLPEEGSRVLLFLRAWGNGAFVVSSDTHGMQAIDSASGRDLVTLQLRSPELMSTAAKRSYNEQRSTIANTEIVVPDQVAVESLPSLVERAIAAAAKPKPERKDNADR
jgi:hypothetical protein